MQKRWVFQSPEEIDKVWALEQALGIPTELAAILVNRAIVTFEEAKCFFRPSLEALYDPFLMYGMEAAVVRLNQALDKGENILVYGDYDVDGTTAVAMVYTFLSRYTDAKVDYYVPDRLVEGYGLSMQAVEKAYQLDANLIITLDCGIKAYIAIERANALGIDVLVCDHHEVGDILPNACAILNPKQWDCNYPFKELSGCGIAFKLLQAFCTRTGLKYTNIYPYLDLVAVSTVCDMVPLVDENRILVYHGIKQLETTPCTGLQAMMELIPMGIPVTVSDIVFKIGPRINVAGRISHASLTVQLLIEQDIEKAYDLALLIEKQNEFRRELDVSITQEALDIIKDSRPTVARKSHVLFHTTWHKGVIGIVAARCIEQYYRPTIILTLSNGQATGSARSVPGYNIYQAISACSDLLCQYGGHAFAAGLTMPVEHVNDFQDKFERVVSETIADHLLIPEQPIHAFISFQSINYRFVNILMQMAPFGNGNPVPVFASDQVYAYSYTLLKERHLRLELYQKDCSQRFTAIAFDLARFEQIVAKGNSFSIAYTIGYNYYLGNRSIQFVIKDMRAA